MACPCIYTMEFMMRRGCFHAAKMHGARAGSGPNTWTKEDWQLHIWEEDKELRPLIAEYFPLFLAVYDADHLAFLDDLSRYGRIRDEARLAAHSAMGEQITLALIDMGY